MLQLWRFIFYILPEFNLCGLNLCDNNNCANKKKERCDTLEFSFTFIYILINFLNSIFLLLEIIGEEKKFQFLIFEYFMTWLIIIT